MAHLKGQNVNLLLKKGNVWAPIAASTSCDMTITANTADAAAKDDPGQGMWDNPEFTNYSWSMSNESFLVDFDYLCYLLNKVLVGDATFGIQYQMDGANGQDFVKTGTAIVSSLTVDATNGDFVKISLSAEGSGVLTDGTKATIAPAASVLPRIKGKALMISLREEEGDAWKTIACASSHKLTVNLNLSDITDKDYNDKAVLKEVTGRSVSMSTENLIDTSTVLGFGIHELYNCITNGKPLSLRFGYYPSAIGQSIHDDYVAHGDGWGQAGALYETIEGLFTVTSLNPSGPNKENATFSAEFQNKGEVSYIGVIPITPTS